MSLSIPVVARDYADFINKELENLARGLNPASVEDAEAVRRAIFSVRNKAVLFERYNPATNKLFSVVQDVKPAEVTVDFNSQIIECTCPQPLCRHKLGVLLGMYQYLGSVQEWRAQWAGQKSVQLQTLATERTPENWGQMVDQVMDHLLPKGRRMESYLVSNLLENAHTKLRRYTPLEREWQPIYRLYIELAVLNHIWAHFLATDSPIHSDYFEYAIDRRYTIMQSYIEDLDKSRLFATDPFYDAIQEQLRQFVQQPTGCTAIRLQVYLDCWSSLFNDTKRAQHELHAFTEKESDIPVEILRLVPEILLKKQAPATAETEHVSFYTMVAEFALSLGAVQYAEQLLKRLLPHLKAFIAEKLPPQQRPQFIMHIHTLYTHIDLHEKEEMQLFNAFGRHGVQPYSMYLLTRKRFEEWTALQLLYPSSIPYLEANGLKQVLTEQPEALLPLYHKYAMQEVEQKSRMNYKQAVRIWKQMKSAAKKSGKMAYFEDYIETVRSKFKRLRALQEELEKANLRGDQ